MSFIKTLKRTGPRIDPCGTPLINVNTVVKTLENDSINLIDWFSKNLMKAHPDKFQAIAIGPKTNKHNLSFDLKGNNITCEENVKLLGITVDSVLSSA
jgi:hypothetical protein